MQCYDVSTQISLGNNNSPALCENKQKARQKALLTFCSSRDAHLLQSELVITVAGNCHSDVLMSVSYAFIIS